jgi:hypothetical protein
MVGGRLCGGVGVVPPFRCGELRNQIGAASSRTRTRSAVGGGSGTGSSSVPRRERARVNSTAMTSRHRRDTGWRGLCAANAHPDTCSHYPRRSVSARSSVSATRREPSARRSSIAHSGRALTGASTSSSGSRRSVPGLALGAFDVTGVDRRHQWSILVRLWHEHELPLLRRALEQLVRAARIGQRQALGHHEVDLPTAEQLEQRAEVLTEPLRVAWTSTHGKCWTTPTDGEPLVTLAQLLDPVGGHASAG